MIYVSKVTCESIPISVQMIYVSKITCESIPTNVQMICEITCKYTSQCSPDLCK